MSSHTEYNAHVTVDTMNTTDMNARETHADGRLYVVIKIDNIYNYTNEDGMLDQKVESAVIRLDRKDAQNLEDWLRMITFDHC